MLPHRTARTEQVLPFAIFCRRPLLNRSFDHYLKTTTTPSFQHKKNPFTVTALLIRTENQAQPAACHSLFREILRDSDPDVLRFRPKKFKELLEATACTAVKNVHVRTDLQSPSTIH